MKIHDGAVIIFPTDTVYGMGAKAFDKKGQEEIYNIKNREMNKRLSILCASIEDIEKIAYLTEDAKKLIEHYMPGPLTIILNTKKEVISDFLHETVGVRIPNHPLALRILRENGPMATTSVNLSGEAAMNDYYKIVKAFYDKVYYIYPNAEVCSEVASTVLNLTTNPYTVLREGNLKFSEIIDFLNKTE